jgi:hypothetical protein
VASRPSDRWRREFEEEAAEIAQGTRPSDEIYARVLWPESLIASTDAALASFEDELHALRSPSDEDILDVVKRAVLTLNPINDRHVRAGYCGYETGERDSLCEYFDATAGECGIDVPALIARNGLKGWEGLADGWREW